MKTLYLIARNHMDPSWLRCFTDHFPHPGNGDVVRPYADIEELQILEYMDFAERYGVKYQIEQALAVKKFLARNPDQTERFRNLVGKGLLEPAGGGETVIDRNLTQGESWARNDLYSRLYYARVFGHTPRYAITPDIFGLPSQLPQYFRSVGYDALIIFDRVLKHNKPFWRGLDGTCIVLDGCFLQPPEPNLRTADCVKLPACPVCRGEGCALCGGAGVDVSYDMTRPDKELLQSAYYGNMSADELLESLLKTEKDEYFVMITTEEPRIGGFLYGPLRDAAARHGMRVRYLGFEENHDVWCAGQVEALRRGDVPEAQIDLRPEGNPAACGCYTSRIEIKKANNELENLLLEAESLCALLRLRGGWKTDAVPRRDYPREKLEALWSNMAFIQFHDCVTGSHCDASYTELQRYVRETRRGAEQIYGDAALEWARSSGAAAPDGCFAAVCLNPTPAPLELPALTLQAPAGTAGVEVFSADGARLPAADPSFTPMLAGTGVSLRVRAAVPAFGWRVFFWKPAPEAPVSADGGTRIENGRFRVTARDGRIAEVFDKEQNAVVLTDGGLNVGEDVGSPWGRTRPERGHRRLCADAVRRETGAGVQKLILTGSVTDEAEKIRKLDWTLTVSLFDGDPLVRLHTALDWDGADTRVFASFTPAFDPGDDLWCEVPFGAMKRHTPPRTDCMGVTDEWPTLQYAGVSDGARSLAVLKGGLPAARLHGGSLQISLLRAFTTDDPRYGGTNDVGFHEAPLALTAWAGDFPAGCCAARAAAFLARGKTLALTGPGIWNDPAEAAPPAAETGCLLPCLTGLPPQLRLSTLKWAQDGDGPVIRLWETAGTTATLAPSGGARLLPCDTLEKPLTDTPVGAYTFRPFEIATFRLLPEG